MDDTKATSDRASIKPCSEPGAALGREDKENIRPSKKAKCDPNASDVTVGTQPETVGTSFLSDDASLKHTSSMPPVVISLEPELKESSQGTRVPANDDGTAEDTISVEDDFLFNDPPPQRPQPQADLMKLAAHFLDGMLPSTFMETIVHDNKEMKNSLNQIIEGQGKHTEGIDDIKASVDYIRKQLEERDEIARKYFEREENSNSIQEENKALKKKSDQDDEHIKQLEKYIKNQKEKFNKSKHRITIKHLKEENEKMKGEVSARDKEIRFLKQTVNKLQRSISDTNEGKKIPADQRTNPGVVQQGRNTTQQKSSRMLHK